MSKSRVVDRGPPVGVIDRSRWSQSRLRPEQRGALAFASFSSVAIHAAILLIGLTFTVRSMPHDFFGSGGVLTVEVVDGPVTAAAPTQAPPAPPAPAHARVEPPPKPPPSRTVPRIKPPPAAIDGVRIATADDVRRRIERGEQPKLPSPPAQPAPEAAPSSAPPAAQSQTAAIGTPGTGGSPDGLVKTTEIYEPADDKPYTGRFGPDTPGYNGRIFGQVSVRSSRAADSFYGRIHLFRESSVYRDYSSRSLFGYSFQERIGEVATRGFETGRVNTPGAYLMVTDLFADGHYSTMSHTVIFAFPRRPPGGGDLYDVVEEPSGDFRLRGPGGSALVFDGRSGALRAVSGFVIAPQGDIGTPPRIGYRGLHLRLDSVGSNPFLRDRPATVVDASGRECGLSTTDLFKYAGRRESDVFRFASDGEFFSFLRSRCDGLSLPEPAPTVMARAPRKPVEKPADSPSRQSQGLLPLLLRGLH